MGGKGPFRNRSEAGSRDGNDQRLMAAGADEAQQILGGKPRRRGVFQRMAIDLGKREQRFVHHHAQALVMTDLADTRASGRVAIIAKRIDLAQKNEMDVMKDWLTTRDEEIPGAEEHATEHGPDGELMPGMVGQEELTRLAVYRETGERSRLMLDVGGHRAQQRTRLVALAEKSIAEVRESGESLSLEPMSAFKRKVVHDAVAAAGLSSESEGAEPKRHVVILPA